MSERDYAIELKLDGTWLRVSLKDGSAWGSEISGDNIDLAPASRAVLSELEAERDRLRDALRKARDVLPGLITDEDRPVDRRAQRALDAIDAALKGDTP